MEIGGAERALLGLLDSFDYDRFDVDLLLCAHTGDFLPLVNSRVNLLQYDKRFDFFTCPISKLIKNGQWRKAIYRILAKQKEKIRSQQMGKPHSVWHAQQIIHQYISPCLPDINKQYDLAINFLGIPSILTCHVKSAVKMAWIHTDYSKVVADPDIDRFYWDKVDWIVNVSDECKHVFDSYYPEYEHKSIVIENILNTELTKKLALENVNLPFKEDCLNLLSIGRFGEAKNFETIPYYCHQMVSNGLRNFKWYIIGYGGGEQLIRDNISKYDVADHVEILGKRVNPYPYIAKCDVYLQPSRFEGKAVTVREAQMRGKPVVVTNYDTATSQINNGIDGIILPMDKDEFSSGLIDILAEQSSLSKVSTYCQSHTFGNESEIEKIYSLIR